MKERKTDRQTDNKLIIFIVVTFFTIEVPNPKNIKVKPKAGVLHKNPDKKKNLFGFVIRKKGVKVSVRGSPDT